MIVKDRAVTLDVYLVWCYVCHSSWKALSLLTLNISFTPLSVSSPSGISGMSNLQLLNLFHNSWSFCCCFFSFSLNFSSGSFQANSMSQLKLGVCSLHLRSWWCTTVLLCQDCGRVVSRSQVSGHMGCRSKCGNKVPTGHSQPPKSKPART